MSVHYSDEIAEDRSQPDAKEIAKIVGEHLRDDAVIPVVICKASCFFCRWFFVEALLRVLMRPGVEGFGST